MPLDYYPNMMLGLICDLRIFDDLLSVHNPKIFQRFKKYEINTGIFLTQWFVCLFSQSLKYEMALVAWDHIILKGSVSLFKIGLVILDMLQANILKTEGL
jgi:TBC1 domain family member 10